MHRLIPAALLACLAWTSLASAQAQTKVKLRFVADTKDPSYLPLVLRELRPEDGVPLPIGDGRLRLKPLPDSGKMEIDGVAYKAGSVVVLKSGPKRRTPHAVRVRLNAYEEPCLVAACARVGKLAGQPIALIDANLNGRYDDPTDMMAVGKRKHAFPFSPLVVIGKKAYRIKLDEAGTTLTATPEKTALHPVDVNKLCAGKLKPEWVCFKREQESGVFEHVAFEAKRPGLLPPGDWLLAHAVMKRDVWVDGDPDADPLKVSGPAQFSWGAPFKLLPRAEVAPEGTLRKLTPAGRLKAPKLDETLVKGTFVRMEFTPAIVGRAGERYRGPWTRADRLGTSLADPALKRFTVELRADKVIVNAGAFTHWEPINMSGLVQKVAPCWLSYDWPAGARTGTLTLTVKAESRLFGALASEPQELELP